jgi:hypothetical protein
MTYAIAKVWSNLDSEDGESLKAISALLSGNGLNSFNSTFL